MRARVRYVAGLWITLLVAQLTASPPIQGRIERRGDIQVVHVRGTYEEMGRAHGHLLADQVLKDVASAAEFFFDTPEDYERGLLLSHAVVVFPENAHRELEGIVKGVRERLGGAHIDFLDRDLTVDDLILMNSMDMLRAFGCSGFTVWGDKAGDAGVITARNFDFGIMGELDAPMMLVRSPIGKHSTVTVASSGYIGAYTGFNDDGVCTFMHDGTGRQIRKPEGRYTPLAIALQTLLEDAGSDQALTLAGQDLKKITPYPFSYLVRVVTKRTAGHEKPVRVFRIDGDGLSENPIAESRCVTTNHYLTAIDTSVSDANPWSITRYDRLASQLDTSVTSDAAWKAMQSVELLNGHAAATLHSVVVYPEKGEFEIAFASEHNGKIVPAPRNEHIRFKFDDLFSKN